MVTLVKLGYESQEVLLQCPERAPAGPIEKKVRMVSTARASISVTTDPDGMDVLLDGARVGVTPQRIAELAPGRHLVVLSHPDYLAEERAIVLAPGDQQDLNVKMRDRTVEYLRARIAEKPLMLDTYAQLAHYCAIHGRFAEAEEAIRKGFDVLRMPGAQAQKEYFHELRDMYMREYNYPRTPAAQNLRKLCMNLVQEAMEKNLWERFHLEREVYNKMRQVPL